ncbi:FAD-binding oxidoreductase [Aquibium sp. LZ166]|uniref:FAD-binding oxidoreductase n=1 Tax=Aquibium pacificus TaxID=3153579 RepID=A0ABV3SFS8_9HYPH
MAHDGKRFRISRRLLLGGAIAAGGLTWAGSTLARLARDPSGPKDAGRIADADGMSLASPPSKGLPPHDPELPWLAKGGELNDASALSRTPVYGVVGVTEEGHVARALAFARDNGLKVSMAAVRHSMGGHAFDDHALVLDMMGFDRIELDEKARTVTVQPGATWHEIQNLIHPRFAVKAMQSTDIFSVGGSISVNAHGMDHRAGSIAGSIRSMRVMLADGSVVNVSPTENADLFRHLVGGYGLFGVILAATLEIVPNAVYRTSRSIIRSEEFPQVFANEIGAHDGPSLFYGHLSTAPGNFLEDMIVYRYDKTTDAVPADMPPLAEPGAVAVKRLIMNLAKQGGLFQRLKWFAEKNLEPEFESCTVPRTQAMGEGEACLVSRNDPMHDSVPYLFNDLGGETDILHEYFVPRSEYLSFIGAAREILRNQDLPVLNASIRVVDAEDIALPYAVEPAFSLVLYINQGTDEAGNASMRKLTRDLIDLTLLHRGRFFLPYQPHYTAQQLLESYPEVPLFLNTKRQYDPGEFFTSTFYRVLKSMAGDAPLPGPA